MKTRGATSFTKAILVLLTSAHLSHQDTSYNPQAFSNWNELRNCAQSCLTGYNNPSINSLGCTVNDCFCRVDILPQAVSIISACASTACSNTNDVVSATSFYEGYCSSATNTAVISLISNPPVVVPGSTVTGTITSTITTTLVNGQPTVVGSIIYQYGPNDVVGDGNGSPASGNPASSNPASGNPASSSPASSSPVIGNTTPKSGAVRQVSDFLRSAGVWGLYAWVTMVMVMAT